MMYQCGSCGGVYQDLMADGSLYFHACPPLEVDPRGRVVERPDKRNENLVMGEPGEAPRMKAEGRGRVELEPGWQPPAPAAEPRGLLARAWERIRASVTTG